MGEAQVVTSAFSKALGAPPYPSLQPVLVPLPPQSIPFLRLGIHRVPKCVVWIIFKSYPCSGVPLGMLLAKALLGIGSKSQLLALPQLDNKDVCRER